MNRIINWVFGSFFRTLGRILVYILIGYLLFNLINFDNINFPSIFDVLYINTNALTIQDGNNQIEIKQPNSALFHNITSNGMSDVSTSFGQNVPVYEAQLSLNPSGYGGAVSFQVEGGFLAGYNYAITTYIGYDYDTLDYYITLNNRYNNRNSICNWGYCSSNWNASAFFTNVKYSRAYNPQSISLPYEVNGSSYTYPFYATQILYIFTANASAETVLIPFNSNINTTARTIYLLGYNIEPLGQDDLVTNSSLNSAISNSGLATANSVSQVQSSINQVQTDINNGTNNIINNQNENTQQQIQSQMVCNYIDKNICKYDNKVINNSGDVVSTGGTTECATDYINIEKSTLELLTNTSSYTGNTCFYTVNKTVISCIYNTSLTIGKLTIPANASYIRTSISKLENKPTFNICQNGNQAIGNSLNDMNSSINNSDSSQATNDASSFFSNFTTNTHGLTGIITAPLNAINSLTSSQCSPLVLPLPFINENLTLPCMRTIYDQYFGNFMTLYDIITLGIVSYWVMVRIFGLVKDFKNPEHDEIEVVDL